MAKAPGRLAVLSKASTALGGVKVVSIKWAGESIDVTDYDSAGIVEVLSAAAKQQITMDVEGVYKNPTLRDIAFDPAQSKLLTDLTFKFSDAPQRTRSPATSGSGRMRRATQWKMPPAFRPASHPPAPGPSTDGKFGHEVPGW
jgi:hypothetical protein